jgi:hypothetical protein
MPQELWELSLLFSLSSFFHPTWIFKESKKSFFEVNSIVNFSSLHILDDETESNMTRFLSTTMTAITGTTPDDDEHDDDQAMPEYERKDEINDSKTNARKNSQREEEIFRQKAKNVYFYKFYFPLCSCVRCQHHIDFLRLDSGDRFRVACLWNLQAPIKTARAIFVRSF